MYGKVLFKYLTVAHAAAGCVLGSPLSAVMAQKMRAWRGGIKDFSPYCDEESIAKIRNCLYIYPLGIQINIFDIKESPLVVKIICSLLS